MSSTPLPPPKAVVLTFDDGLADFYHQAFPLLRAYQMPATVYLSTYYCYKNLPVFGLMVRYLIWRARQWASGIQDARMGWVTPQQLNNPEGVSEACRLLDEFVAANQISADGKEDLAKCLAQHLKLDYGTIRRSRVLSLMTPEEVREVYCGGVSIELHTHRHRMPQDPVLLAREINENSEKIREITGCVPRHFCYPSGVWRPEMFSILSENGVLSATTCDPGLTTRETPPLLLPRHVDTTSQTEAEFQGWLSGVSEFLPKRRRLQNMY